MKSKMQFIVTVDIKHEKRMPKKEIKKLGRSVIGENACYGSAHGGYSAEVKKITINA